ncbi:MAG: O-methyltransferase [Anaerolineae bacterium]|nr:O-methyltransferase [Anaerolineae bacterium]
MISEPLDQYVNDLFAREDDVLRWIRAETERNQMPAIHVQPFDGRLLQILMIAIGARRVVEIGTLAGYSAVWLGRALPPDGKLYTLEKSSKHAEVARASFARAGLSAKIDVLEGTALDSLRKLAAHGPFDFVFIDADKASYPAYLDWSIENLRPGGMITAHNAFRDGRIVAPESDDDRAMLAFNAALASNPRLASTIIGIGDGMAVALKKS